MTKKEKLRLCDIVLLVVGILVLASSIQMETSAGADFCGIPFVGYMVIHLILAFLMITLVIYHLYLHFGWKKWIAKLRNAPKKPTRVLSIVALVTLLSGLVALAMLLSNMHHTSLGGVHGKLGFIFIAFALGHTIKRAKWLKK